jgi:hypothetical protein
MEWRRVQAKKNYFISEYGHVYSILTKRILKGEIDKDGYLRYRLYGDGTNQKIFSHRLVAMGFHPNQPFNLVVNHIDANKRNNHFTNLEWCTVARNNTHTGNLGLYNPKKGDSHYKAKLSEDTVLSILGDPCSLVEAEIKYGYDRRNIYRIRNGNIWRHVYIKYLEKFGAPPIYRGSKKFKESLKLL